MHLVFLIHGLLGNPSHMLSMKESLKSAMESQYKKEVLVYRAQAMSAIATFDGVEKNAQRLLVELLAKIEEIKPTHISIVGYSMGGLCGRYLIGLLQDAQTFDKIIPVLFATFATPHLGSMYTKEGAFGKAFNFLGAHVAGDTGPDLFGTSKLLTDLADPTKSFYEGLKRFQYLYLFANAFGDRTVHFWSAYLAPKNPFEKRSKLDLHLYESVPIMIDMSKSRCVETAVVLPERPLKDRAARNAVKVVLPVFLVVLLGVMGTLTVVSKTRQRLCGEDDNMATLNRILDRNRGGEAVAGGVGSALEDTLDYAGPGDRAAQVSEVETEGLPQPSLDDGFVGLIDSAPSSLYISPQSVAQMESLNKLPWRKYAVAFSRIHTHGDIVDRKQDSVQGKQLMNFFADRFVECHKEQYKRRNKL